MKAILLFVISIFCMTYTLSAQSGKWTWMHGDDPNSVNANCNGVYGTQGVAASTNEPPCRYQCAYWTDLNGNFWIFGGVGGLGELNDLWKFNPTTNQWTWMNGAQLNNNPVGNYGTIGVPSVNNYPSARGYGANGWTDKNNNLWLYGGSGSSDDLWKYNIATNEWTWVKGNDPSVLFSVSNYGTIGVAANSNTPGTLQEIKSGWTDKNNMLWFYGGQTTLNDHLTDMWKYDISTNMWTCIKGGATTINSLGVFGTKGVEAVANIPPARASYTKWKDKNDMFYIFAGANFLNNNSTNDLWRYNMLTNSWTWLSGPSIANDNGVYQNYCSPSLNDLPSSRYENQTVSTLGCASAFWSFGGFNMQNSDIYNDLWIFNSDNNEWTWVSGSQNGSQIGNFGTKGVYSPSNMIESKGGVGVWSDNLNNLWVFGGFTSTQLSTYVQSNDLWKFEPDTACFHTQLSGSFSFSLPADTVICVGESTTLTIPNLTTFSCNPMTGVKFNIDTTILTFNPTNTTTYTLIGANGGVCGGNDTITFTIVVVPNPIASFDVQPKEQTIEDPTFNLVNNSSNAVKYEWYYNGSIFSTQTNTSKTFDSTGHYCFTLIAYNSEGCADSVTNCGDIYEGQFAVVPNCFSPNGDGKNDVIRAITKNIDRCDFRIYDRWGELMYSTGNPQLGWNGYYKTRLCENGVYYYYFQYLDYKNKSHLIKGDITLIK